jgi:predicted nucleic acid-binding protein
LIPAISNKHLLLDTNIFLDGVAKPEAFNNFFNTLKSNNVTLTTIDLVMYELLKGSSDNNKYQTRQKYINEIIQDVVIPITPAIFKEVHNLVELYGIDGAGVEITDLFLAAILRQYKENIFLLSKDTSAFIQRLFKLSFIINLPHAKGISTYGVYQSIM